jgi:hypothetical protein
MKVSLLLPVFVVLVGVSLAHAAGKTSIVWNGFGHPNAMRMTTPSSHMLPALTNRTLAAAILKNKASLTHVSVIAYMIDIHGRFACSCDPTVPWQRPCNNNGSYIDCPWWDAHISTLHDHGFVGTSFSSLRPANQGSS